MALMAEGERGDLEFGTTPRLVKIAAARFRAREAIVDGGVTLSFQELANEVRRAARGLIALHIEPGERVALWAPNSWEWIVAALAVQSVGATIVPINTRCKGVEAATVLAKSGARALFMVTQLVARDFTRELRDAPLPLRALRAIIALRGAPAFNSMTWRDLGALGDNLCAVPAGVEERRAEAVSPADACDLLFTSGTTGEPKGVLSTHAQTLRAFRDWSAIVGLRPGDRYLIVMPFSHTFGYKAGWLACLMSGATIFPDALFDVDALLVRLAREAISVFPGPPAIYQTLLARPDLKAHDLSRLRVAVTGAAPISADLIGRMRRELNFKTIVTAYGLTEATGVTTMTSRDDPPDVVATTSGRPIPGVRVRIVDETGRDAIAGGAGQIAICGYTVMKGYVDNPEASAEAIDANGWLITGDFGRIDARGNLTILGRKGDMFIVGGFNVSPAEVEAALERHPAVAHAAVVGVPDGRLGEVGAAFVVTKPSTVLSSESLLAFARTQIANYKVPRFMTLVPTLPVNGSGKVLKQELRQRARDALAPRHVRPFPAAQVTSRNALSECDPREAGLAPADVDAIWGAVVRLYEAGLEPAAALCLRRRGKIVIDRAIGHVRGNAPGDLPDAPKVLARHDSLFNLFSASKAVTAMVVHLLDERRLVHLDDPVAEYIPEFGTHGKELITLRQILTHRSGIPSVPGAKVTLDLIGDFDRILHLLCEASPRSVPGRSLAYHALTGGYIMGEVVKRVTGRNIRQFLHDEILAPLDFQTFNYGVSPKQIPAIAENAFTGFPPLPPQSWLMRRVLGVGVREATELSNEPRFLTTIIPSGNIIGTAEEASRFFQLLLDDGTLGGVRVFDPRTVRRAIAEQVYLQVDSFLGMPVRYAMGFMLGSKYFSPYGPDSPLAFGHLGFTNVIAYADPARDISVGLMTSGKPFITPGQIYWLNVTRTIARRCAIDPMNGAKRRR